MAGTKNKKTKAGYKGIKLLTTNASTWSFRDQLRLQCPNHLNTKNPKNPCCNTPPPRSPPSVLLLLPSVPSPFWQSSAFSQWLLRRRCCPQRPLAHSERAREVQKRGEDERLRDCSWRRQFWLFYDLLIAIAILLLTSYQISFFLGCEISP